MRFRSSSRLRLGTSVSTQINTRAAERGLRRYFGRMSDDVKRAVDRTRVDVQNEALYWPGAAHPVAQVNHPGTRPQPFLRPAIEMTEIFWRANASQIGRR